MRAGFAALVKPAAVVSAALLGLALAAVPAAASSSASPPSAQPRGTRGAGHQAVTPVKHFIFLMQGGRTFDNYFGTYPGADGLSAGTCQLRVTGKPADGCVKPFLLRGGHLPSLSANNTIIANQYNGGKMDGFVAAYQRQGRDGATAMGHYDGRTLAFYWKVASDYVLFDHFFSSNQYGIRNNRSYWVSAVPAPGGHRPDPAGRLRGPADDLRPAPGGRRELEVLRPGLQPHADVSVRVAGQPGDPDLPGAPRRLLPVHSRPGARQPHRRPGPVLQGSAGRDVARGRVRGVRVRL